MPFDARQFDAVLFDVDDTLVDFAGAARLALLDVVREHLADLPGGPDEGPAGLVGAADRAWDQVSETEYRAVHRRRSRFRADADQPDGGLPAHHRPAGGGSAES